MTERELFYRYLGLPSFSPMALDIVKASGVFIYDRSGKDYIDMVSGISVSNVGHRHPQILEAIKNQLDAYLYVNVYGEFIHSPQVKLAEKLIGLLPSSLDSVYFVNSGSEAIEGALKLVKRYTGRSGIIAFKNAYHGSTHGSLSILGNEAMKQAFRPLLPDVNFLEFNNFCDLEKIDSHTACVVAETIQAEAGLIPSAEGFMFQLRKRCNETGALLIIDDVQMGFGRTGSFFSFEPYGIVPDILVLAKALGAGMPLGAFIASKNIMETLAFQPELGHITTFGGHPVSCAAAIAGIDVLLEGHYPQTAEKKGKLIEDMLADALQKGFISGIRRRGLALGIDLADPSMRKTFLDAAIKYGVLTDYYLFNPATFRIAPPLTITEVEILEGMDRLLMVFRNLF
ncbi:MAG: aminotransferase class III-fold pyridoxal phosphate-dependent enzyme [Bacteroidetes bacterium]|nr:aminotransferase class III-fold pyridoxal phosphate-dependent enzyme [Bacteroidota bacterium]